MNLKDVKTLLKTMIETKTKVTPMLWAQHGVGKSSVINQVANDVGYDMYTLILSQKEPIDVGGVLYTYEHKGLGRSVTAAHPPEWFAQAMTKGNTILFLDEFNMARKEVLNAAFEIVLDRRLNNITLPDTVFVVCAGNPDDGRYDVTALSESLLDRMMHIQVIPEVDVWVDWAKDKLDKDVVNFIKSTPNALYAIDSKNEKFPVDIKHSARSWERLNSIYKLPLSNNIKRECYRGIVGIDYATSFIQFLENDSVKPFTLNEMLELTPTTKKRVKDLLNGDKLRMDVLSSSVDVLVEHTFKDSGKSYEVFLESKPFLKLLPSDMFYMYIEKIVTNAEEGGELGLKLMNDKECNAILKEVEKAQEMKDKKDKE